MFIAVNSVASWVHAEDPSEDFQTCLFQNEFGFANPNAPFALSHFNSYVLGKTTFSPLNAITIQNALMPAPREFIVEAPSTIWAPAAHFYDLDLKLSPFVPPNFEQFHLIRYPLSLAQVRPPLPQLEDLFVINRFGAAQISLANQPSLLVFAHSVTDLGFVSSESCERVAEANATSKFVCYPITRSLYGLTNEMDLRTSDEFTGDGVHKDEGDSDVVIRNAVLFCTPASTQKTNDRCVSAAFESSAVCYRQVTKKLSSSVRRFVSDDLLSQYTPKKTGATTSACQFTPIQVSPGDELVCLPGQAIPTFGTAKKNEKELVARGHLCH
jgi:hypothetical protein